MAPTSAVVEHATVEAQIPRAMVIGERKSRPKNTTRLIWKQDALHLARNEKSNYFD
jgi:hypothetical protein